MFPYKDLFYELFIKRRNEGNWNRRFYCYLKVVIISISLFLALILMWILLWYIFKKMFGINRNPPPPFGIQNQISLRYWILFFSIGFNIPFNTFQVISGQCLFVTEGMIVLCHCSITPQAQSYDIPPGHSIQAMCRPVFALNCPLHCICRALDKGASTTNFKSLVWLDIGLNPRPPRHRTSALPQGYRCSSRDVEINSINVKVISYSETSWNSRKETLNI